MISNQNTVIYFENPSFLFIVAQQPWFWVIYFSLDGQEQFFKISKTLIFNDQSNVFSLQVFFRQIAAFLLK